MIQLIMAALGSLGFGILLGMKPRHLLWGMLGGALSWGIFLLTRTRGGDIAATLFASLSANVWATVLAHRRKAPAVIFTITAVVPLIPGSGLYYTMRAVVERNAAAAATYGTQTLLTAAAIGFGTLLFTAFYQMHTHLFAGLKRTERK